MQTPRFHRDAISIPTTPTERRALIQWLLAHKIWTHPDSLLGVPTILFEDGHWTECVDIEAVFVNPDTLAIAEDETLNTLFRVRIEAGPWSLDIDGKEWAPSHSLLLDCGGPDLETALCELAVRVKYHFGDGRERLEGVQHERCDGTFDADDKYIPGCESRLRLDGTPSAHCAACGFRMNGLRPTSLDRGVAIEHMLADISVQAKGMAAGCGLSLRKIAHKVGVAPSTVRRLLDRGIGWTGTLETLARLANACGHELRVQIVPRQGPYDDGE